ncbi:penicillin-binding protein 1C, partial [candidate division KSB1 bacterium]|nr:penicillin-binding protein 1C [candidate division KSB1 bacterium]
FTYGLALENGFTPASLLPDIETHAATLGGDFNVRNYDETFHGPVRLRTALACSYNVPAVRVLENLGADLLLDRLHRAGFGSLDKPASHYGLALTLGSGEVRLFELVTAFRALAMGGTVSPLRFLANDKAIADQTGQSIFSPQICFLLSDMLNDASARIPAFGWNCPLNLPFSCAAKTGTSKDYRDNWTIGYTRDYTVGVWVGNFDGTPMIQVSGISGAAPIFRSILLLLHRDRDPLPFDRPEGLLRCEICSLSGDLPSPACDQRMQEWFLADQLPLDTCSVDRWIAIDKRTGARADKQTPPAFIEKQKFQLWPEEYTAWLVAHNRPLPPPAATPATATSQQRLQIAFPDDGDLFKIDPILRPEYQILHLEAIVPAGIDTVAWFIDDSLLGRRSYPFSMQWKLRAGEHTLRLIDKKTSAESLIRIKVY